MMTTVQTSQTRAVSPLRCISTVRDDPPRRWPTCETCCDDADVMILHDDGWTCYACESAAYGALRRWARRADGVWVERDDVDAVDAATTHEQRRLL